MITNLSLIIFRLKVPAFRTGGRCPSLLLTETFYLFEKITFLIPIHSQAPLGLLKVSQFVWSVFEFSHLQTSGQTVLY